MEEGKLPRWKRRRYEGESTRRKSISGERKAGQTITRLNRELPVENPRNSRSIVCLRFKVAESRRRRRLRHSSSSSLDFLSVGKKRVNERLISRRRSKKVYVALKFMTSHTGKKRAVSFFRNSACDSSKGS